MRRAVSYIVNSALRPFGLRLGRPLTQKAIPFPHVTPTDAQLIGRFAPYTLTDSARQFLLMGAMRYVDLNGIQGDFVECGVWRGGASMLAKAVRGPTPEISRSFHLYDTFAGMTEPTEIDVNIRDRTRAKDVYQTTAKALAPLDLVKQNFRAQGLFGDDVIWHVGRV